MDELLDRLGQGMDKLEACDTSLFEMTKAQIEEIVKNVEEIVGE